MKHLIITMMLTIISGCMMPNVKQLQQKNLPAKYPKLTHARIIKRHPTHTTINTNIFSQDGVPIVNLMAHQGGNNA